MNIKINRERCFYTHAIRHLYPYQIHNKQRGALLIGLIVTMIIFSILGASMVYMLGSSTFDPVFGNFAQRSYYAAESGMRFATAVYRNDPANGLDNFFHLDGSELTFPNNGKATLAISATTGSDFTATTDTASTGFVQGGNLVISCPNNDCSTYCTNNVCSGGFPEKNGFFTISGISGYFRYRTRSGNTLQMVTGPSDSWTAPATITSPKNQVSITSKGFFPFASIFGVSRTVEYGWILSGGSGGPSPSTTDMNNPANWTSIPKGESWGDVSFSNHEMQITAINEGHGGAILGFGGGTIDPFYNAWLNYEGKTLSYRTQIKVKSTTPYFAAGLNFRMSFQGSNYTDFGIAFSQDSDSNYLNPNKHGDENIPGALLASTINGDVPVYNKPLMVLFIDYHEGQTQKMKTIAYKTLDNASGVFSSTNYFQDNFPTNLNNWTTDDDPSHKWIWNSGAASSGTCIKKTGINTLQLTSSVNVATASTLTFLHGGTFNNQQTGTVYTSIDGGTTWTQRAMYQNIAIASNTLVSIPIYANSTNFKVKFVMTNKDNSDAINNWAIDNVSIQSALTDWSTIMVRIQEKILTSADASPKFAAGTQVNDIRIYYSSTTPNGSSANYGNSATDNDRCTGVSKWDWSNPSSPPVAVWPPCDPADTTIGPPCNDTFTLVQWTGTVAATDSHVELLSDGYTIRTTYNLSPTTTWDDRPEIGIFSFGSNVANNVFFTDAALDFSCECASCGNGVPFVLPLQQ